MSITAPAVTKIAKLARIKLNDADVVRYTSELSTIMDWIEQLSEVDDGGIDAVASVTEHSLPMREDVVTDGNKQPDIVANAPVSDYGCFVVPKVIDQG